MIDGLRVPFPYDSIYPEQVRYMHSLKRAIDNKGQGLLEMPTGTGKTVSVFSLVCAYQRARPEMGKLVFCTRTVPEMTKALRELAVVNDYQDSVFNVPRKFLAIGLSARKNLCVNAAVAGLADAEAINGKCRSLVFSDIEDAGCSFYRKYKELENMEISGVFTIDDLKTLGIQQGWCPYYASRKFLAKADVVVFSYQYLLDARVSASAPIFGPDFAKKAVASAGVNQQDPAVVVFDEAHNIDEVCIESLTVRLNRAKLDGASDNVRMLFREIKEAKRLNADILKNEVEQLLAGAINSGRISNEAAEGIKVNPYELLSPEQQALIIPGSIRKAENFLTQLQSVVAFLKQYIRVDKARVEGPLLFLHKLEEAEKVDARSMKAFSVRLRFLITTLKIVDVDKYLPLSDLCELCSSVSTHARGFAVLSDPFPDVEGVYDPQIELSCLDASIAMRQVVRRFETVVLTSGTLSPLSMYPRLLGMDRVVVQEALMISLAREAIRPLVVTRGNDQTMLSSKFDLREDADVLRNYGHLLEELVQTVPDGIVCFFTSKVYMRKVIKNWFETGALTRLGNLKPCFFETEDVVETTYALANYRKACDQGRGGIFFSIARGKVSEGIDFDRHYGRCVVMFGIPFQYTLSRRLRARLEYIKETHAIQEAEFLTFDAMRAAAQCVGRVLRSKADYGIMVFADFRYARTDKRNKLPEWISKFIVPSLLNLTIDMAIASAREFLLASSQPFVEVKSSKPSKLTAGEVDAWIAREISSSAPMDIEENIQARRRVVLS